MKLTILVIAIFLRTISFAQIDILPDSLKTDWSKAGYEGAIPKPSNIINVKNFGAFGDSLHDDYNAVLSAINASSGLRVIYFPAGKYLIKTILDLPSNVVLRGEGESSTLYFSLANGSHAILISGGTQYAPFVPISSGYNRGSNKVTVTNAIGFTVNGFAEIRETNGAWYTKPASTANYNVGQIVRIKEISGNQLTIDGVLRIDYETALHPEVRPITPKENVGIECLKVSRIDPPTTIYGANIYFSFANNCWVTGVESEKSQGTHVLVSYSSHISISGSYFHDAFTYDGAGSSGYGVTIITHSGDCKIENNIFKHLRHSMVAKQGANGNVFGYNYSFAPNRTEFPSDAGGDILLHGHYAFANLFEGNIAQNLVISDTWGPSGPYNTFFRNRLELYGITISNAGYTSDRQNIIGNEVTNAGFFKGNYSIGGTNHFLYGNNIRGSIQPSGATTLTDKSYYLSSPPYYWNSSYSWPNIGIPAIINTGTLPSKERYINNAGKLNCFTPTPIILNVLADSIPCFGGTSTITIAASGGMGSYTYSINGGNYQLSNIFMVPSGKYRVTVKDAISLTAFTDTISILSPSAINATATAIKANSCNLYADGKINVKATGGIPPYTYNLNNGAYRSSPSFSKLTPSIYLAGIKDSKGCFLQIQNIKVDSALPVKLTFSKKNVSCIGANDGTLTLKGSGGISPLSYSINGGVFQPDKIYKNLIAGTYSALVKDSKGCVSNPLSIRINSSGIICPSIMKTGTTSQEIISEIVVYPNPSSDAFTITLPNTDNPKITFILRDALGKIVLLNYDFTARKYSFGNELKPGMYLLEIQDKQTRKLVKLIKQ